MQFSPHQVYIEGDLRLDTGEARLRHGESLMLRCCGYLPGNHRWNFPRVLSPYWRLYYNFAPGRQIRSEGRTIKLNPDRFVLIPENVLFHCESASIGAPHLYIHFNLLPGQILLLTKPVAVPAGSAGIGLAKALKSEVLKRRVPEAGHLSLSLLHWVFSRLGGARSFAKSCPPSLHRAVEHIGAHLSSDLSNSVLARIAGMSLRAFVRSFAEHMNVTPQLYVRQARVREAARQLAGTSASIDQIAEGLGFSNRYYFTRVFKSQIGVSPAKFRKLLLQKRS